MVSTLNHHHRRYSVNKMRNNLSKTIVFYYRTTNTHTHTTNVFIVLSLTRNNQNPFAILFPPWYDRIFNISILASSYRWMLIGYHARKCKYSYRNRNKSAWTRYYYIFDHFKCIHRKYQNNTVAAAAAPTWLISKHSAEWCELSNICIIITAALLALNRRAGAPEQRTNH